MLIRKFINQGNSTFGADVMMGAGNASGRLGPLIILSAAFDSYWDWCYIRALGFTFGKPIAGGAILGAMILVQYSQFLYNKKKPFCFALSLSQIRISVYIIMLLCYYKCEIIIILLVERRN